MKDIYIILIPFLGTSRILYEKFAERFCGAVVDWICRRSNDSSIRMESVNSGNRAVRKYGKMVIYSGSDRILGRGTFFVVARSCNSAFASE